MSLSMLRGEKELLLALKDLGDDAAKRVMRSAISKALTPVKQQAKINIKPHRRSGALEKAISKKAGGKKRSKKAWGKVYVKSKPQEWEGKKINPVKYAGILEFGSLRNKQPATVFMRRALASRRGQIKMILKTEGWKNMVDLSMKTMRKRNTMKAARPRSI